MTNANTRANDAQAALDRFKAPRTLSADRAASISQSLSQFSNTPFSLAVAVDDHEAFGLLDQIVSILQRAGWHWVEWNPPAGPFMFVYTPAGKPNIGQNASNLGVVVEINPDHFSSLEAPTTALVGALNAAGIVAKAVPGGVDAPNREAVSIRIGKKAR